MTSSVIMLTILMNVECNYEGFLLLSAIMLIIIQQSVIMHSVVTSGVIFQRVVMLTVIMRRVMALQCITRVLTKKGGRKPTHLTSGNIRI